MTGKFNLVDLLHASSVMRFIKILILSLVIASCSTRRVSMALNTTDPELPPGVSVVLKANGVLNEISVVSGTDVSITWSATNATSCNLLNNNQLVQSGGASGSFVEDDLESATSFSIACMGQGQVGTAFVNVSVTSTAPPVGTNPPTSTLTVHNSEAPPAFPFGVQPMIRWTSSGAAQCTVYRPDGIIFFQSLNETAGKPIPPITQIQVWSLNCSNAAGSVAKSVLVDVIPPPPAILSFSVDGTEGDVSVVAGTSIRLRWHANFAAICEVRNSANALLATGVSNSAGYLSTMGTTAESFRLACIGAGGTVQMQRNVSINAVAVTPSASITVNGQRPSVSVPSDSNVTVAWTSAHVQSCVVKRGTTEVASGLNGSISQGSISAAATFSVSCQSASGVTIDTVNVGVQAPEDHVLFITANRWNGNLGGVNGADAKCESAAHAAGLRTSRPFKAIVSGTTAARDRITLTGEVKDTQGNFLGSGSGLWSGPDRDIDYDEEGEAVSHAAQNVWSGSNNDGTRHSDRCNNWTSSDDDDDGRAGATGTTSKWLNEDEEECDNQKRLYCISQ